MTGIAYGPINQVIKKDQALSLGGRVLVGPITLGDEFTIAETSADDLPCRLKIVRIELFGVEVAEVESAMTPTIDVASLDSEGVDVLGAVLRGNGAGRTTYFEKGATR